MTFVIVAFFDDACFVLILLMFRFDVACWWVYIMVGVASICGYTCFVLDTTFDLDV